MTEFCEWKAFGCDGQIFYRISCAPESYRHISPQTNVYNMKCAACGKPIKFIKGDAPHRETGDDTARTLDNVRLQASPATIIIEKVARAICRLHAESSGAPYALYSTTEQRVDGNWQEYLPEARAAIEAIASAVTDEMGDAFETTHTDYWNEHWSDTQGVNFSKTRKAADRIALAAAIRAALKEE